MKMGIENMSGVGLNPQDLQKLYGTSGVNNLNTLPKTQTLDAEQTVDLSTSNVEIGSPDEIAAELEELQEELGITGTDEVQAALGSSSISDLVPLGEQSQKVKEELEALEEEKQKNIDKMDKIEDEINTLADKAAKNIAEAAAAQQAAVKENQDESQATVDEQLQAYIAANKEGGEGMTREELQNNIKNAVPGDPDLGNALSAAVEASEQLAEVDSLLGDLNSLIKDTQAIEMEIDAKTQEFEAAVKADQEAAAAKSSSNGCCDPMGFVSGEGDNAVQYNFFVDKDGDGDLSQTNEFLGAQNQWAEMQAADLDMDGTVTAEELEQSGISLKGSDGSVISSADQYIDAFGEDFSIDLNSYEEGGSHSAVDPNADSDGDGIADQQLLGTFNVNANGESIKGYNTLDDVDWLSENFGVEISEEAAESNIDTSALSEDLRAHGDFYNFAFERNQSQKEELREIQSGFNLTSETLDDFQNTISKQAGEKAANFIKSLDATKEESDESVAVDGEEIVTNEPNDLAADANNDINPFEIEELFAA